MERGRTSARLRLNHSRMAAAFGCSIVGGGIHETIGSFTARNHPLHLLRSTPCVLRKIDAENFWEGMGEGWGNRERREGEREAERERERERDKKKKKRERKRENPQNK